MTVFDENYFTEKYGMTRTHSGGGCTAQTLNRAKPWISAAATAQQPLSGGEWL